MRTDQELVEQAKRGDVEAYGEIVTRYQALAQRTAYVITRDADAAEDAAQEAFVKAYRALDRFRSGAPLRPWLLRIVANEALNRAQAHARRALLVRALNLLREDDRVVIAYRWFFDLSEAEMAEALGIARGTVKSRLSRAMARLRERIGG